jgi:hypothetical protein
MGNKTALSFQVKAKCSLSKARSSVMKLLHSDVDTPVFMPVGTQVRTFAVFFASFVRRQHFHEVHPPFDPELSLSKKSFGNMRHVPCGQV